MIKKILLFSSLLIVVGLCHWRYFIPSNSGIVIILNGPSGAGKTTTQKEFQKLMMPNLWIKLGIDSLFDLPLPDITPDNINFWNTVNDIRWVEQMHDSHGNNVIKLKVGPEGQRVAYAMNSAIAAYAQQGCNVIVDYIAYDQDWFKDLQMKLSKIKTFYVAVRIPLQTLEEREASRGTSPQGHARSHYDTVYGNCNYDLVVHSDKNSPESIAQQLKKMLKKHGL